MAAVPKEVLDEYIAETREMCERVSLNLNLVERGEIQADTLNSIYRDIHSIKGTSQLFGFHLVARMAHAMESTLDPVRNHTFAVNPPLVDALYAGLDCITKIVASIISDGQESLALVDPIDQIISKLTTLTIRAVGGEVKLVKDTVGVSETKKNLALPERVISKVEVVPPARMDPAKKVLVAKELGPSKETASAKDDHASDSGTIRIQVGILDNLMNLIGELVLIRNQLLQIGGKSGDSEFVKIGQRLNVVTSELQNDVMKTRMQPVGSVVTKFHRVVRDMCRDLSKKIELTIEGADTELDKTLIEAVKDPLTHLVRNSIDHGIERPDDRRTAGKRETGSIAFNSYHEGGQVIIEIVDDGRGLDPKKIAKKAVEKGVIAPEQCEKLSEHEMQMLIFAPGFSTADVVSNISGRGVGMDVVKTNIERIGGTVELESQAGLGMKVRLKIPLTLAIIPALIVQSGGARFAIPQAKVSELVRVERDLTDDASKRIEFLQDQPVYRLRGKLLPLVELSQILGLLKPAGSSVAERLVVNIVVLHSEHGPFGLIVDEVVDSAEIVVKPLAQALKGLIVYSGATIMGDGSVVLILDLAGLATVSHIAQSSKRNSMQSIGGPTADEKNLDVTEYLLMDVGVTAKYAVPLCLVRRLEKFERSKVQQTGDQQVVLYRDKLLPIVSIPRHLGLTLDPESAQADSDDISVIVMSKGNQDFGLAVSDILDVVPIEGDIDTALSDREGVQGSLIHGTNVLVVLDALAIMDQTMKRLNRSSDALSPKGAPLLSARGADDEVSQDADKILKRWKMRILFAEDTPFFRKVIKNALEAYGFQVTAVKNGEDAFKSLSDAKKNEFALILTDIEMPLMNGFELASKVRENPEWQTLPMIALTTRCRDQDIKLGKSVGFNQYLEKFDPDQLLAHLDQILGI